MITDELRKYTEEQIKWLDMTKVHYRNLLAIADRIDEECERRQEDVIDEVLGGLMKMTDENMEKNGWVRLPKDADGVPTCVGDVTDKGTVTCICNCGNGWEVILNSLYTYDASSLHHQKPTVEDVLREMLRDAACQIHDDGTCEMGLTYEQFDKYAKRLQLRED